MDKELSDRGLLELAARAAGITPLYWRFPGEPYSAGAGIIHGDNVLWNPLNDDGDALRLAVKLEMLVNPEKDKTECVFTGVMLSEPWGDDQCAATRRAIARCAAEIGKGAAL